MDFEMQIKSTVGTKIKAKNMDSSLLPASEVVVVPAGVTIEGDFVGDNGFVFSAAYSPILAGQTWFLFKPHWATATLAVDFILPGNKVAHGPTIGVINVDKTEFRLPINFFKQNDNDTWDGVDGNVQCCPTNNSLLAYHRAPGFKAKFDASGLTEPEDLYKREFEADGWCADDRGNHDAHTSTLIRLGLKTTWTTAGTGKQILAALRRGDQIVCGVEYGGAGHIMSIVGYYGTDLGTPKEVILGLECHDCYGLRDGSGGYGYINPGGGDESGAFDKYSWVLCEEILFSKDGTKTGAWVRWID